MKYQLLMLFVTLSFIFTACDNSNDSNKVAETLSDGTPEVQETSQVDAIGSSDSEDASVTKDEEGELDVSLLDRALLSSVRLKYPKTSEIRYEGTSTSEEDGETITEMTKMVIYSRGRDKREENTYKDDIDIDIYLYEEGINYQYTLGETEGDIDYDDEEDRAYQDTQLSYEGQSLLAYLEAEMDMEEDVTAFMSGKARP